MRDVQNRYKGFMGLLAKLCRRLLSGARTAVKDCKYVWECRNVGGGSSSLRNVTEAVKQSSDYGCKDSKNEGSQPKACTPSHDSSRMEKGLSAFKDEGASPENKLYQQKPSGDVPQASGDKDQESNDGVSQASGTKQPQGIRQGCI